MLFANQSEPLDLMYYLRAYGIPFAKGVVVFLLFYFASWLLTRAIRKLGPRANIHQVVADLLAQGVKTTLLIIGAVCALGTMGVDVTGLVAALGLLGFALGFALKDVISNALAGILILYYRPFWMGDRIKVLGHEGTVTDIDLRYTTLTLKDSTVLVPSSNLLSNTVEILEKNVSNELVPTVSAQKAEERQGEAPATPEPEAGTSKKKGKG